METDAHVAMDTDETDDVIVEEIPVFLSRTLTDYLYLLQYPTKTSTKNIDKASVLNCCVKPIHNEVKVDFALNTETNMYDRFKGELIALAADGKKTAKTERPTFKRGIMDKHTYKSSSSLDDVGKYMVGVYADREIHVTPLKAVLQMHPSFSYFDKEDSRTKAEQRALDADDDDEDYQQVTVKFARNTNPANPTKKTKERNGYDSFIKKIEDEPWCETFWHPYDSTIADLERQRLFSTCSQQSHALMQPTTRYVNKILPNDSLYSRSIDTLVPSPVVSKRRMKTMTLSDQLRILLRDAKMLTFADIVRIMKSYVDPCITTERILNKLPQIGVLLKGNWVVQSDTVYPPETASSINGVSAKLMVKAREYIIFKLSRNHELFRPQMAIIAGLPPEEMLEVLSSVGRVNNDEKWEPLLPPCHEFEQRHPDLVQRQEMVWRATEHTFIDMETEAERSLKRTRVRSFRETKPGGVGTNTSQEQAGPIHIRILQQ